LFKFRALVLFRYGDKYEYKIIYLLCYIAGISLFAVISRVLSQSHSINNQPVQVQSYLECIGVNPPGFDSSSPFQATPDDIELESVTEVVDFVLQNTKLKAMIEHVSYLYRSLIRP